MKKKDKEVGFSLIGIKTEQFAILEENYSADSITGLGMQTQFKLDQAQHLIGVNVEFALIQNKKTFLKIVVSCHFHIRDAEWENFIDESKTKYIVPKNLLTHLTILTVGTARGVLFAKTEGTLFASHIIPVLNVEDVVKEDAIFEIRKV